MNNNVLIVTGNGRSGTSFVSSWLHACGLNMGEELLGPRFNNIKGHFEDIFVLDLHERLLKLNNCDLHVNSKKKLLIDIHLYQEAKKFVEYRNAHYTNWGWKEPRTTLFLDMWETLIPNAHYLFMFRHYLKVVNSYMNIALVLHSINNEGDKISKLKKLKFIYSRNKNVLANNYLDSWIRYNTEILNFLSKTDDNRVMLIQVENLLSNSNYYFSKLEERKFDLNYIDPNTIYETKLYNREPEVSFKLSPELLKTAEQIWLKLCDISSSKAK